MSGDGITDEQYFAAMHDMERRAVAEARAFESIPTEALEAGVVEKMVKLIDAVSLHDLTMQEAISEARAILRQIKGDHHG